MKSSYKIDDENNLISAVFEESCTVEEMISHANRVNSDPKFCTGMNTIADLTEVSIDWNFMEIDEFRSYLMSIESIRGECKWAVIHSNGITNSTARIFIVMCELWRINIKTMLFSNMQDANNWIRKDEKSTE